MYLRRSGAGRSGRNMLVEAIYAIEHQKYADQMPKFSVRCSLSLCWLVGRLLSVASNHAHSIYGWFMNVFGIFGKNLTHAFFALADSSSIGAARTNGIRGPGCARRTANSFTSLNRIIKLICSDAARVSVIQFRTRNKNCFSFKFRTTTLSERTGKAKYDPAPRPSAHGRAVYAPQP